MKTLEMMFGGGANVAELAEMIRRFGRGEDKVLAHITPEEAAMLKEAGGSGEINPMTGLPEFQEDDYGRLLASEFEDRGVQENDYGRLLSSEFEDRSPATSFQPQGTSNRGLDSQFSGEARFNRSGLDQPSYYAPDVQQDMALADQQRSAPDPFGRDVQATDENVFQRGERGLEELSALLNRFPNLSRIGGAGANVIGQALLARRANRQRAVQAQQQRERAVPFRAAEAEAMARARGGGLTPQNARRLEAEQAKARQDLSAGNRGASSAAAGILAGQEQRTRSVARQESFDEALKQAGIADEYERRAIASELAADKEMAALFGNILANEISAATRTQAAPRRP